jgi:hypothetical protein
MRYSIMLQIVVGTTLILVAAGAFFGRLQTRPVEDASTSRRPTYTAANCGSAAIALPSRGTAA